MRIRYQGFTFNTGIKITRDEYIEHLLECGEDGGDFELTGKKRIFHFSDDVDNDYFVGLFVTIKDHKKLCSLDADNKILVFETGTGEHLMDFNYFVLNKTSLRGLYQHYHQSCSINQFGTFLKHRYNTIRDLRVTSIMASLDRRHIEDLDKEEKKQKRNFGYFSLSAEVKKEILGELLDELERVSSFEYCVHAADAQENQYIPASDHASRIYNKCVYSKNANLGSVVNGITSFVDQKGIAVGKVRGYDPEGLERLIKIVDNPSFFSEHDFDEVVSKINGKDIDDLAENWLVNDLLEVAKQNDMEVEID